MKNTFNILVLLLLTYSCKQQLSETRLLEVDSESESVLSPEETYYDSSYDTRYPNIAFLASNFNVEVKNNPYGLWSGIMHQTRWQQKTNRDKIYQWRFSNTSLTIEPYYYARHYQTLNANCQDVAIIRELQDLEVRQNRVKDCQSWFKYFEYVSTQDPDQSQAQKLMWAAHSQSLTTVLLEDLNFSTTDFGTKFISQNLLPPCGPLKSGSECQTQNLSFGQRKLAEILIQGTISDAVSFLEALN